jgi:segregation and condensation protein A
MTKVLATINSDSFVDFSALFDIKEGRMGVVVTFIAILELIKQSMIEMVQAEPFAPIHVKAV